MFTPFAFVKQAAAAGPSYTRNIVADGLMCYLDAGISASYPGSGTTWFDLSPNGFNFTQYGSPTFVSSGLNSFFVINQVNGFSSTNTTLREITLNDQMTVMGWVDMNSIGNSDFLATGAGEAGSYLLMFFSGASSGIRGHIWASTLKVLDTNINFGLDKAMATYIVDWNAGQQFAYKNAGVQATGSLSGATKPTVASVSFTNVGTRGSGGGDFNGRVYSALWYNRRLTDAEVTQNYNAFL
jgi:hypothetical protein